MAPGRQARPQILAATHAAVAAACVLLQTAVAMLARPGLDDGLYLFAAQTLRTKASRQLAQLGRVERYLWLRDQALHLADHLSHTPVLQRYCCLTLVALIVQWDAWTDALAFLGEQLLLLLHS